MITREQKINNIKQMLKRDGFTDNEITFIGIDNLNEDMANHLLDRSCDEYEMFKIEAQDAIDENLSYHMETIRSIG